MDHESNEAFRQARNAVAGEAVREKLAPTTVTPQRSACCYCAMLYGHQENCPLAEYLPYRTGD